MRVTLRVWFDPSSEDLCRRLAAVARERSLLLLMTSRLPLAGTRLEVAGVREIRLRSLADEDIQALVDAQVDPYPARPRLRQAVAERAQGNPFFVEELVRAFRERGDLVLADGSYDLSEAAAAVVPPSLHALIAARIDRLPPSARELLADAAVLGKRFPLAHLRILASGERVDEDLAQLERRGLLDRETGGGIAMLSFHHVLTQEVAYGALLQADRKAHHRRAAETIESLYRGRTEEVCDQLAHHWARSDRPVAALPYLVTAADGAVGIGANQETITHLQSALDLTTTQAGTVSAQQREAIRFKPPACTSSSASAEASRDGCVCASPPRHVPSPRPPVSESFARCSDSPLVQAGQEANALNGIKILKGAKPADLPVEQQP